MSSQNVTARVGVLSAAEAERAAEILAARQSQLRAVWPAAGASYEAPSRCLELLEPLLAEGEALGAWRGSLLVGFVVGVAQGRFGVIPAAGHGVRGDDRDVGGIYGMLYALLAERWVERGVAIHDVELPALQEIEDGWNELGFGRRVCIASRPTAPHPGHIPRDSPAEVRIATLDDLSTIAGLSAMEIEFRAGSPMFLEGGPPDLAIVRANHEELFALGAVHFLASVEAEPVGLLTLLRASRFAPICAEDAPFVSTTVTDARYRGKGIGGALVAAALAWAREREYDHLDVSYLSSNLLSRSFWRGCGFAPIGWKVARRLPDSLFKVGGDAADQLGA